MNPDNPDREIDLAYPYPCLKHDSTRHVAWAARECCYPDLPVADRERPKVGDVVRIIGKGDGCMLIAWKPGGFPPAPAVEGSPS